MISVTPLLERHCCSITVLGSIAMLGITVMFVIVAGLSYVNISSWQIIYFIINLICASFISVFAAIYQVASVTLASALPNRYMEAVFSGQAVAGITASLINIIALGCTDNQQTSAVVFFGMAAGITLVIYVAFMRLLQNPFFLTFRDDPYLSDSKRTTVMSMGSRFSIVSDLGASTQRIADLIKHGMTKGQLVKELWSEMLTSFNSPFLTMSLFPGLLAHTRSNAEVGLWSERFFVPVLTFLVFNCADYIGRALTSCKSLSIHIRAVTVFSFVRYGFWIIFPLCQIDGKSMRIPTVFTDDWIYALIVMVFGYVLLFTHKVKQMLRLGYQMVIAQEWLFYIHRQNCAEQRQVWMTCQWEVTLFSFQWCLGCLLGQLCRSLGNTSCSTCSENCNQ